MKEDIIESIPKAMEKFLGFSGKMVKPSVNTVKVLIKKVPKGKLVTLEQVREKLALDFKVQTTCPASIAKALQLLSKEQRSICYWRVVKKKGVLLTKFPGGIDGHADLLKMEGQEVDMSNKHPAVKNYEANLYDLS